jgi:transcriptional regulator NrdR family protein
MALRRLIPELVVVDTRRSRPAARFDPERLRRSFAEPVRKIPIDGFKEPLSQELMPAEMSLIAGEYVLDFVTEALTARAPEPNGQVTTDAIASLVFVALNRMHVLAFLRSTVHHRLMPLEATDFEIARLAELADALVAAAHTHTERQEFSWPALREPPTPVVCPRCGTARIARRSRATVVQGLDQQPASCGYCGQRFALEWGSQAPMLVTSEQGESLFDVERFRGGIRSAVRKLPGTAAIWSDEKLVVSAAHSAAVSAIPFIRPPTAAHPVPSIEAGDLWLAAADALRTIHPLAFVRFALHSGAVDDLDWQQPQFGRTLAAMGDIIREIGKRYFSNPAFPSLT